MAIMWYISIDGIQKGPMEKEAVVALLKSGNATFESPVWRAGMKEWKALNRLPEFASVLDSQAPASGRVASSDAPVSASVGSGATEAPKKAWDAVKILLSDPMSGQGIAAKALGQAGCVQAGAVLCAAFALAGYFAVGTFRTFLPFAPQLPGATQPNFDVNLLIATAVPPAALIIGFFLIGKIFGGKGSFNASVLVSGTAFLPFTFVLVLARFASAGNIELIAGAAFFAVCFTILLLYAASVDIHELSTTKAFLMVPVLVLATGYLAKVILVQLIK